MSLENYETSRIPFLRCEALAIFLSSPLLLVIFFDWWLIQVCGVLLVATISIIYTNKEIALSFFNTISILLFSFLPVLWVGLGYSKSNPYQGLALILYFFILAIFLAFRVYAPKYNFLKNLKDGDSSKIRRVN